LTASCHEYSISDKRDEDQDALTLVINRFQRSENYCQPRFDKSIENYKRYRFYRDNAQYPYKHRVKDRLTFTLTEVLAARIMQTCFAVQPFISFIPTEGADVLIAKQLEKVVHKILSNPDREFFLEFLDWIKQELIMGTSYLSISPNYSFENLSFNGLNFECEEFLDVFPVFSTGYTVV